LQEIRKFEGADITSAVADFDLQVSDDLPEVLGGEPGFNEVVPHLFPVKTQGKGLPGQLAIEPMKTLDGVNHGG